MPSFPFRFNRPFRLAAWSFGVRPGHCEVRVTDDEMIARYGPWTVRTPLSNIKDTRLSEGFGFLKAAGPARLSLADRGLTFATNSERGVCLRFHRPVRGIDPAGLLRHPGLTVTVADCAGLRAALDERARTRAEPLPEEAAVRVPGENRRAEAAAVLGDSEDRIAEAADADRPADAAHEHRRSEETT